jgi:hypothetical protein
MSFKPIKFAYAGLWTCHLRYGQIVDEKDIFHLRSSSMSVSNKIVISISCTFKSRDPAQSVHDQ